mmetsp:Transcript_19164/g.47909  ORF Transcript_19164/g.47909 Transcript_19164/m.47909 type:complete len:175 (+) Transcript_19164:689-1213(+)
MMPDPSTLAAMRNQLAAHSQQQFANAFQHSGLLGSQFGGAQQSQMAMGAPAPPLMIGDGVYVGHQPPCPYNGATPGGASSWQQPPVFAAPAPSNPSAPIAMPPPPNFGNDPNAEPETEPEINASAVPLIDLTSNAGGSQVAPEEEASPKSKAKAKAKAKAACSPMAPPNKRAKK